MKGGMSSRLGNDAVTIKIQCSQKFEELFIEPHCQDGIGSRPSSLQRNHLVCANQLLQMLSDDAFKAEVLTNEISAATVNRRILCCNGMIGSTGFQKDSLRCG